MLAFCQASFPDFGLGTRFGAAARFGWVAPLLLVALAGCGGPSLAKVTGTLTHKGKPVPHTQVNFVPEKGRPSQGITDEEGHFTLEYERGMEGVALGKHIVSLRPLPTRPTTKKEQEAAVKGKVLLSGEMASFFDKYSAKHSKYEVVIDKNTTDLKLDLD